MPPRVPPERARCGLRALALVLIAILGPATRARGQAAASPDTTARRASPFSQVPLGNETPTHYAWSYAAMGSGAVLVGGSFLLGHRANDTYDAYLRETDPSQIERLFDRSVWYDRGSSGSLLAGEALLCLGLYGRFLHRPQARASLAWQIEPGRCAFRYRF